MVKKNKKIVVSKIRKESIKKDNGGSSDNVQKVLIENFVSLQNVIADLSSKLNNLSDQMSKLLGIFEESAKTFMEKDIKLIGGGSDKGVSDKLDQLLEQNKILARGITLLHEANFPDQQSQPDQQITSPSSQQIPQFTQSAQQQSQNDNPGNINRYQRSISSPKY